MGSAAYNPDGQFSRHSFPEEHVFVVSFRGATITGHICMSFRSGNHEPVIPRTGPKDKTKGIWDSAQLLSSALSFAFLSARLGRETESISSHTLKHDPDSCDDCGMMLISCKYQANQVPYHPHWAPSQNLRRLILISHNSPATPAIR
ncbi:hypothetical protein BJX68DRAFT_64970 [Aspergillus pseudodeflectus]|uniref:4Fe-4S ferredoxin-type domain-containing protein n=1 Tax=Aspergillus pseudodeflectus TaxID=176178 RepID=A0ABR4KK28_9EURO